MKDPFLSFLNDAQGATSVEYAIMVSLVALAVVGAVTALGGTTKAIFSNAVDEFENF